MNPSVLPLILQCCRIDPNFISMILDRVIKSQKVDNLFSPEGTNSVYIICEIGINHNGSLNTALSLIDAAKQSGVDAVKFQKRDLDKIYAKEILSDTNSAEWNFDYLMPLLKKFELTSVDYLQIKQHCQELGLDLIVTPFDENSADFVYQLGISAFKISSADMTNFGLIKKCASYNLPLIISTGMWNADEIKECAEFYKKNKIKFALLLANSSYPTPYEAINLKFLENLKVLSPVVGYSGHERGIFIPVAAVALGAKIVEKHITFDRNAEGPDHKASLLPEEFTEMVDHIRMLERALGKDKEVNQAEKLNKEVFAKSAVADLSIKKGHILKPDDISFKSPGKGIFPHQIEKYYGLVFKKNVAHGHYIADDDFVDEKLIKDWKKFSFVQKWGVKCRFHDFADYQVLNSPVIEFHCSETDLDVDFIDCSDRSELIVHAPEIVDGELVDICTSDKRKVDKSIVILQKTIEKVLEISKNWSVVKPKIVVHLGGMLMDRNESRDVNKRMMERAITSFARLDFSPQEVDIIPENLPPRPWYLGGEWFQYGFMLPEDFLEFCGHFGLGMTLDICHAALYCNYANQDLAKYVASVKNLIKHVHISDAKGINGEGLQIYDGEINFESVFSEFKDLNFSWVPEIWSGHLHHGSGVYQALNLLEKYNGIL